jgi:Replication-relaxation
LNPVGRPCSPSPIYTLRRYHQAAATLFGTSIRWKFTPSCSSTRPASDGLGVWSEVDRTVAFYLEQDTGTEALTVLVDKLGGYRELRRRGGLAWPVLFWLHSTIREGHLHRRLTGTRLAVPVATAARDRAAGNSPADAIWHVHGHPGPLRRLSDLPMPDTVNLAAFDDPAVA